MAFGPDDRDSLEWKYDLDGPGPSLDPADVADYADVLDVEEILHELETGDQTEAVDDDPEPDDAT